MPTRDEPYIDKFLTKSLATLGEPEVTDFLQQPNISVVAWISPSGGPRTTPIWYQFEQGAFWLFTEEAAAKTKAIRKNPEVSLTIDERSEEPKALMVHGRAEVLDLDEEAEEIEWRMYSRYVGEETVPAYRDYLRSRMTIICIRIVPERAIWMDLAPMAKEMGPAGQ